MTPITDVLRDRHFLRKHGRGNNIALGAWPRGRSVKVRFLN